MGRYNIVSLSLTMACMMTGSPILCLDVENRASFDQMEDIESDTVIIDTDTVKNDIDLSTFSKIQTVYTLGRGRANVKTRPHVKLYSLDVYDTNGQFKKVTSHQKSAVRSFEPIATKSKWVGFNASSGSTGKPKLQIYPNRTYRGALRPSTSGIVDVLGPYQTLSLIGGMVMDGRMFCQFNYNLFVILSVLHLQTHFANAFYVAGLDAAPEWPRLIAKYRCTTMIMYVPQLLRLTHQETFSDYDLSCVKFISCGGGQLTPQMYHVIRDAFRRHHDGAKSVWPVIKQVYGSTELGPGAFSTPWSTDPAVAIKSVGKPAIGSNWRVRIRHLETGQLCHDGEEGEVEVYSTSRMVNYWHCREEPPIGWFKMGDLGHLGF